MDQEFEPYVPTEDVAKLFNVNQKTIRAWVRQGFITPQSYVKLGHTLRFRLSRVLKDVERLHEGQTSLNEEKPEKPEQPKPAPKEVELPDYDLDALVDDEL